MRDDEEDPVARTRRQLHCYYQCVAGGCGDCCDDDCENEEDCLFNTEGRGFDADELGIDPEEDLP